jgi:hypothetical protein
MCWVAALVLLRCVKIALDLVGGQCFVYDKSLPLTTQPPAHAISRLFFAQRTSSRCGGCLVIK